MSPGKHNFLLKIRGYDIVNLSFLDGVIPRHASYGVYISQLIRFASVRIHVTDFNAKSKLLQQCYRYFYTAHFQNLFIDTMN